MRHSNRRGFSLAETLIAMVLIGIISGAFIRVIIVQSRFYDRQNAKRNARAVSRNAMNVILSDLRMVQDTLGIDSISTDGKTIRVRVPYAFGLVCNATAAAVTASMLPLDSAVAGMGEYGGYAFRNTVNGVYTYVVPPAPTSANAPTAAALPATCTGTALGQPRISTVSLNGRTGAVIQLTPGDLNAVPTTALFYWQRITYSFSAGTSFPNRFALYRKVGTRPAEEIMGPFDGGTRFRVYWTGDDTSRTVITLADTTRIKGLDIVLTGLSEKIPTGATSQVQTRMVSSVFFKNVRNF